MPISALWHIFLRLTACGLLMLAGRVEPAGVEQQATFRTGVDVVTVDVSVLDGSGRPVEGLTGDQFDVRVERAPRRVVWAEYVRQLPRATSVLETAGFYDTNEDKSPGRLILVAVDQVHIRRIEGRSALRAAASFIDALDPADRIAAAPVNHGGPIQFTGDHASVKKYLQTLTGEASPVPVHFNVGLVEALAIADGGRTQLDQVVRRECGQPLGRLENPRRLAEVDGVRDPCPVQIEQESRALAQQARTEARLAVDALHRLIARLAEIDGPKALVLISEGLVAEAQLVDLTAVGAAAQAARVTIYVLQLDVPVFEAAEAKVSPTFQADLQVRADGLSRLAGSARGALFRLVGADPFPFRRILTELGGHYLVAFESADSDRDGQPHRIDVTTRGSVGTVRARPSFSIPLTPPAPGAQLERLLRSPRLATELPVRLAAYTLRDVSRDGLKALVTLEIDGVSVGRVVTTGFVLVDDRGVIVASNAGSTDTGRYTLAVPLSEGRYLLKAAAVEPSGRQGSVERKLVVRLNGTGAIRVSDLILAEPSDVLIPSIVRARGDRLVAYLEVYGPAGWSPPEGGTIAVTPADGSAVLISVPAVVRASSAGRWIVRADIPLNDLPAGSYRASARLAIADVPGLARSFVVGGR